jgi:hypothetical protein
MAAVRVEGDFDEAVSGSDSLHMGPRPTALKLRRFVPFG